MPGAIASGQRPAYNTVDGHSRWGSIALPQGLAHATGHRNRRERRNGITARQQREKKLLSVVSGTEKGAVQSAECRVQMAGCRAERVVGGKEEKHV